MLDLIGGENAQRSLRVLRPGGLLIVVPSGTTGDVFEAAAEAGVRATGFLVEPDQVGLEGLAQLVDAGRLHAVISQELPLSAAADAHEAAETGHAMGKIVLDIE